MKIALKISLVIANLLLIVMGLSFDLFHDNFSGVMRGYFLGLLPCALILALAFFHAFKGEGIVMFIMGEIMVFVPYIHVLFAYLGVFFMTLSLVIRIEKYRFSDFLLIKKSLWHHGDGCFGDIYQYYVFYDDQHPFRDHLLYGNVN